MLIGDGGSQNEQFTMNHFVKIYNNTVKQARIYHFQTRMNDHKNKLKFLFRTIDLLTNKNFNKSPKTPGNSLCEDFTSHFRFRTKINDIRSSLLSQQILSADVPGSLNLPKETLRTFPLVDARMLGWVFTQIKPTTCLLDPITTAFQKKTKQNFMDASKNSCYIWQWWSPFSRRVI